MFEATVNVICQAPNKTKGFIIQQGKPQSMPRWGGECVRDPGGMTLQPPPLQDGPQAVIVLVKVTVSAQKALLCFEYKGCW